MTCVIALIENGIGYLGGDLAATRQNFQVTRKDPKVFMNGQFGIAVCGSIRMHDLLKYVWTAPTWRESEITIEKFMRNDFIESLKTCFKSKGFGNTKETEDSMNSSFIVVVAGHIFIIEQDFQVGEPDLNYYADGSGFAYALGSLYSTTTDTSPKERIMLALAAAESFAPGVRSPFTIIEVIS